MAFTKEEHENLLKEIAMTGGDTNNMLKLLQRLRDDFDEREGMLEKYNELKDKEKPDSESEEKEIVEESKEDNKEDGGERRDPIKETWEEKYNKLKTEYIERFFSTPADAIKETNSDVKKDDEVKNMTFDDLFKRKEK